MRATTKQRVLTQARLKELVHYDPETGVMTRKVSRGNARKGAVVGSHRKGYVKTTVDGQDYLVHRLVYLYMIGFIPNEIDHINGNGRDNRWSNLRVASISENNKNKSRQINNTSGVCGVYYNKAQKKWRAYVYVNSRQVYLGQFDLKRQAILARKLANQKFGFTNRHGSARA